MRRLLTVVLALLLLAAACGEAEPAGAGGTPTPDATGEPTPAPPEPSPTADDPEPTGSPAEPESTPEPEPTEGAEEALAFFARSTERDVWVEPVRVTFDDPAVGVARAAIEAMIAGPPDDADPSLETFAPAGTRVLATNVTDGGVLIVDLSSAVREGSQGSAMEVAFAHQLAHTGAQFPTVERVQLWVDGREVDELWGHLDWSQPLEPDPFALTPVTFDSHRWGEEVPAGSVTVGGEATVFEATVVLRLYGADGDLVEDTFTTATEGGPGRGDWQHTFEMASPGRWAVEAAETDPSDGEGRPPVTVRLELEVR